MSDEQVQTTEQVVNAFYPDVEAEPLEAPTDEVVKDEAPEETEVVEAEVDAEESEGGEQEADEVEDVQVIEIDGVDHNLADVQEWKEAHDNVKLMQADCTKKWQEASDLKKDAEAHDVKNQELTLELEALLAEDEEVDLDELKDYDEVEYYKRKEKIEKRKAKVKELKANQPTNQPVLTKDELIAESTDFYAYDPKWQDEGQLTEAFKSDMNVARLYLEGHGYSQDEVNAISRSHHWKTIIDASKYKAQNEKVKSIKKKVLKTPKATKPAAQTTGLSLEDRFYPTK